MWNQDTVQAKIKVLDLPSASCYMTAGVFILSFQNKLFLDNKAQVRIDLRHQSMTLTVQSSGYFTDRMDGLCGQIGNNTWYHSNNVQTSQPLVDWRLLPGLSLFENYELLLMTLTPQMPECDCSLSSYETSCPKSSAAKPQFLFHLKETTFYWINKTQGTNQIPDYMFEGDIDDEEIETKQPVKDGQLTNDSCKNMFMTSGIAKTCLNKIRIDIDIFTQYGWEPVGDVYTTLLRYVDSTTVECMLPMVTRGDDFVNVYKVQIPKGDNMVLRTQIVAVLDSLCQMCDISRRLYAESEYSVIQKS
ncbi:unnamed protein product [Mytilus edulis]|uniref:Uncharacterized protein n=1 Tax=Mytilus edulis TaxID=6550 RepID=A0A8S3RGE8_MYTED|nr:unnamed protein product [Mytilus edulis]